MKKIGMVGIGLMGHGIAMNIQKHGYSLVLFEHSGNQPLDTLIERGATSCNSLSDLASQVDAVLLCVTGSPQVEHVLFTEGGLLEGIKPGTLIIDCSTAIPSSTQRIAVDVEKRGGYFIDAPMTRTPKEAAEGRLNLTVGGRQDLYEMALPLLQTFTEKVVYTGAVGSGHQLKLIHNFVSLGFSAVLAEAAACAKQAGISPEVFLEVVGSGGGNSTVLERFRPFLANGDENSFRFYIANALKDMGYYTAMASDMGVYQRNAESVRKTYEIANDLAAPNATVPELVTLLSNDSAQAN